MDLSHNSSLQRTTSHNDMKSEDNTIETVVPEAIIPYMTIIEQMPDACLVLDMQWRILYFNQQAAPFLPKLKADLLGHNIWETFPKIHDSPLYAHCQQVKTTGQANSFEYFAPVIEIWFQVSVAPLACGICIYFREITVHKQAEALLRQSEEHYRALIENSNDGIALTDEHGVLTYVSPLTTRLAGIPPEEFIGHDIFEQKVHPDDYLSTKQLLAQVLAQPRKSHRLEYRTATNNGTYLWLEVVGTNLLDEPQVKAIVWNFRAIAERKLLEQEIANAREQLEAILQNVAEGILVADTNHNVVYTNDSAAHAFGFPSAAIMTASSQSTVEHLYKQFTLIQDEKNAPVPFEALSIIQALNGKKAQSLTQCQSKSNGQVSWSLTKAQPIFDAQGKVELAVSVFADITERKEMEQRKDHFISMASHELKTPLTIASAFTELLQEQFTAEGRQDVLRILTKLDSQISKLNKLVVDMLDISKMQMNQLALRREVVDINKLIHEVVENLQPTTNHHLLIEAEASHAINGDRDRLEQVLIILLSNAIKYSPQADSVIIKVTHAHDTLVVSVQDFGIGIAQNHQKKLFERFYRVLSDKVQTYPGLGMGLYLAREIIQQHGGKIVVESVEGQGSTFCISLPMID